MSGLAMDRLPCGCRMGTVNDNFVFEPCSLGCKYARYAIAESKRQGKPIYGFDKRHAGSIPTFAKIACPHCGKMNEAHTRDTGDRPTAGAVAVCWGCRQISIYEETSFGLTQRLPTPKEQQEIEAHPNTQALLTAMRESYTPLEASDFARELGRQE